MQLERVRVRGVATAFARREVAIDFAALGPGLIALTGDNGAGKTTLMEASAPAVIYRDFPSYGETFAEHIVPGVRDAEAEVRFRVGAHEYRALIQADPLYGGGRGKTEAFLWCDGHPVAGPLVRDYDAAIARLLPPRNLFLASVYACQGGDGSFFNLAPKERKELFVRLLGLERMQALSAAAGERAKALVAEVERRRENAEALRLQVERVREAENTLAEAEQNLPPLVAALDAATADVAAAQEALQAFEARTAEVHAENVRRATLRERRAALTAQRARLDVDAIVAAERGLDDAEARRDEAGKRAAEADAAVAAAARELAVLDAELTALRTAFRTQEARLASAREAAEAVAAAGEGERAREEARAALEAAETRLGALEGELPDLEAAAEAFLADAVRREQDGQAAALLEVVPGVAACGTCPLTGAARAAAARLLVPPPATEEAGPALEAARREVRALRTTVGDLRRRLSDLDRDLANVAAWRSEAAHVPGLAHDLETMRATGKTKAASRETLAAEVARLGHVRDRHGELLQEAEAKYRAMRQLAGQHGEVARLDAALDELGPEEPGLAYPPAAGEREALAAARAALDRVTAAERAARDAVARARGAREALGDPAGDLAAVEAALVTLGQDAAAWGLVERGLGRDGAQALEIDAAGPAVTTIANDLLASCYGDRFALRVVTTEPLKGKKGTKEVFNVEILDAEQGRAARRGSGGEMVILDEALRLALAIHNTRVGGYELRTLWRDETAGALSPENAARYVAMLRRARELGGFEHIVFIAHQEAVWRAADAVVHVTRDAVTASPNL